MSAVSAVLARDLRLARRAGAGASLGLMFFLVLIAIVPFAIGADQKLISRLAPALLWIAALLATLLGLDRLFQADEEDGALDQFLLSGGSLTLLVLAKALAHWLVTGLPLSLAAPVLGLMLAIEPQAMLPLALSLLVGTPALTLIGLVGAALTVSLNRGGLLLSLLVVPTAIPTLIFGVAVAKAAAEGRDFAMPLTVLCGTTLFALAISPLAAALALRQARG
ncbi:MAG: heme exporter protein CcmB [Methylobacterium sp.]|jgi:heme exporter protein B|nr:heme exporter protein CcmB [Methylobacterium sp.]MCA3598160.1 heme exporter protein CcmB [Methylobacterium sp.]MCA3600829.1 heme exporter protein CcmB [Methylobacterium sp.]MCA3603083.1 heme exporter protein CcmB [Methylobacterium sp.]MCA3607685.1 heme exporter protein CcmB [Methylobacterium sp.]